MENRLETGHSEWIYKLNAYILEYIVLKNDEEIL